MSQKPIIMEQLKQILQLKCYGIGIREIARRTGISRNSVRKYLAMLPVVSVDDSVVLSNKDPRPGADMRLSIVLMRICASANRLWFNVSFLIFMNE